MFIAIYEFDVKGGMEQTFVASWLEVTKGIYQDYGSYGSRLHKDKSGKYIGYAQWPDKQTWKQDWSSDNLLAGARETMWSCLDRSKTVYEADVVADYLKQSLFMPEPGDA